MPLKIKKIALIIMGSAAIGMGVLGIILPVLPTTPFLLIAAYCYTRSSERMYFWLINHRVLGVYIRSYLEHRAITRNTKIIALISIWVTLPIALLLISNWYIGGPVFVIGVCVSIYIIKLKTLDRKIT
jgi:uncharacterized membrane protein YbaN (DUF454 family)